MDSLLVLGPIIVPFLMAWWMWRRMKRVNARMAERNRIRHRIKSPEEGHDGRGFEVNEELVNLGEQARQSRWPLN